MIDRFKYAAEDRDLSKLRGCLADAQHTLQRLGTSKVLNDPRLADFQQKRAALEKDIAEFIHRAGDMLTAASDSRVLE